MNKLDILKWNVKNYLFWLDSNKSRLLLLLFAWNMLVLTVVGVFMSLSPSTKVDGQNCDVSYRLKQDRFIYELLGTNVICAELLEDCNLNCLKEIK